MGLAANPFSSPLRARPGWSQNYVANDLRGWEKFAGWRIYFAKSPGTGPEPEPLPPPSEWHAKHLSKGLRAGRCAGSSAGPSVLGLHDHRGGWRVVFWRISLRWLIRRLPPR